MVNKKKEVKIEDLTRKEQVLYGYWETMKDIQSGLERTR